MHLIDMKSRKKEKNRIYRDELSRVTGIRFSDELTSGDNSFPYLKYVINALILFCSAFGSLNCIFTAFKLEMTVIPMAFSCAVAALVFSFMYISKKAKIITYLAVLVGIIFSGSVYFSVINSGMSAIRNNCLKLIDQQSGLPFLREFSLSYNDEYAAMSVAACLLAVALMLFINIFVSERMSLLMLFALTFPFVQFGMFFDLCPSGSSMIMVASSWVTVAVIKFTDAYNGLTVRAAAQSSVKKHRHSYGFVTDSANTANISGLWLSAVLIVTAAVFIFIPDESFDVKLPTEPAKKYSEKYVKNFLSYGLGSVFAYESNPSVPGSLPNVSSVYFDGSADIKATLVNYMVSRIYIKEYTGYNYNSQKKIWEASDNGNVDTDYLNFTADLLKYDFENGKNICKSRHRMDIEVVDPTILSHRPAIPYFSGLSSGGYYMVSQSNPDISPLDKRKVQSYEVYTLDTPATDYAGILGSMENGSEKERLSVLSEKIRSDAYRLALDVPEKNIPAIEKFCTKYGISADDADAVEKVISALEENYEYTLKPGKTPYNEDYVNYFLLGSEKGYCQHFASAAVLIFRYLGIPARYAEGYAIDKSDFTDSEIKTELDYSEWIDADYAFVRSVNTVDVKDEAGHAWVEIYRDGIGWIPVEATTAAPVDSKQSALSGVLGNLFGNSPQELLDGVRRINVEKTKNRFILLILFAVILAVSVYLARMVITIFRRHRGFRTGSRRVNLGNRYIHLRDSLLFSSGDTGKAVSYRDVTDTLSRMDLLDEGDGELCRNLEKFLFSKGEDGDYSLLTSRLIALRRAVVGKMTFTAKLRYYFVKMMW